MRQDNRLSRLLHVLIHMADHDDPLTSEQIAGMFQSNPALVRRVMGTLRKAGYVTSEKGHGGGWRLAAPLNRLTLFDIYQALGEPALFAFGFANHKPECLVEQAVNETMASTLKQARAALLETFKTIRLSDIAEDYRQRREVLGKSSLCSDPKSA